MSDFVTRLAERAMGTAPVVQPLIASRFAPEPASRWTELEGEPASSTDDPDQTPQHEIREPPPVSETPRLVHDDATTSPNDDRNTDVTSSSKAPDSSLSDPQPPTRSESSRHDPTPGKADRDAAPDTPGPRRGDAGKSGPLETGMDSGQEGQQHSSSISPRPLRSGEPDPSEREAMPERNPQDSPRTTIADGRIPPASLFEITNRVEPAPTGRGADQAPRRLVPRGSPPGPFAAEDGPGRSMIRTTTVRAETGRVTAGIPAPPSRFEEDAPGSETVLAGHATPASPGAAPAIVPRIVRHQPDQRREDAPREPRVLAPEPPAPTIRVAIGRIEVRAVTPPPEQPAWRETPARPGPLLSLDDYLKQRNGGRP